MRPEISEVIRKLYPNLEDSQNVKEYPRIRGTGKDYFFFHHEMKEKADVEGQSASKVNPGEAEFVLRFAFYLTQQGYKPEQVTILSLYTGQLLHIRKLMKD
mmetsp:Transcript_39334/g.60128  ORF Transcript_39334/g.60128 Transcript_39334/m.60128 type:complete len:101 (-) Transcript_39334:2401-2703(-)